MKVLTIPIATEFDSEGDFLHGTTLEEENTTEIETVQLVEAELETNSQVLEPSTPRINSELEPTTSHTFQPAETPLRFSQNKIRPKKDRKLTFTKATDAIERANIAKESYYKKKFELLSLEKELIEEKLIHFRKLNENLKFKKK